VNVVKDHERRDLMASGWTGNEKLAALIAAAGITHAQLAATLVRVAAENGAAEVMGVGRSHISHWVAGSRPSGRTPQYLCEALSRHLGRVVAPGDIGFEHTAPSTVEWSTDSLNGLSDFIRPEEDVNRREALSAAAYSAVASSVPPTAWWAQTFAQAAARPVSNPLRVGLHDVEAVNEATELFSRLDQRRGGGHARAASAAYLTRDVAALLRGRFADEATRRAMYAAAGELAYVCAWMAFDHGDHGYAQRGFRRALSLAAAGDAPPLAGHILRAMAHQAVYLGHPRQALALAEASMEDARYRLATPRERALLGVVNARTLAATGDAQRAAIALLRAEDDLAAAHVDQEEPRRVAFFGEASLAHESAFALRDCGDLAGAERAFERSVRVRDRVTYARTHAVTLGYLGAIQQRRGELDRACATWSRALDAMEGIQSGRARDAVLEMRAGLAPLRRRGPGAVRELDRRAAERLAATG
jgi:hypothetical protein